MEPDREAGPLERVVEQAIAQLSEHPQGTRDVIRSQSGMIADAMKKTLENENATLLERWAALARSTSSWSSFISPSSPRWSNWTGCCSRRRPPVRSGRPGTSIAPRSR